MKQTFNGNTGGKKRRKQMFDGALLKD